MGEAGSPCSGAPVVRDCASRFAVGATKAQRTTDMTARHHRIVVGLDGSIDWLCFPRFDSPACFAALLGNPDNGRWLVAPKGPIQSVSRRYLPGTTRKRDSKCASCRGRHTRPTHSGQRENSPASPHSSLAAIRESGRPTLSCSHKRAPIFFGAAFTMIAP